MHGNQQLGLEQGLRTVHIVAACDGATTTVATLTLVRDVGRQCRQLEDQQSRLPSCHQCRSGCILITFDWPDRVQALP
jgi:hypothetical protein